MEGGSVKRCLYYLVRYVPNVATGQFVNVGLFLYAPQAQFLDCLFTDDFTGVERLHPHADLEFLRQLQAHFEQEIGENEADLEGYLRALHESYSTLIQISEPQRCVADDPEATLSRLLAMHVGTRAAGPAKPDTRMRIKRRLANALEHQGVTDHKAFQKDIPAAQWTGAHDTFRFDFAYRPVYPASDPHLELRVIHAVSLLRNSDLAETLAWEFRKLGEKIPARLVVAHEDIGDTPNALVQSSQAALRDRRVDFVPVASFGEFARWIRWELGM
jgi:hypothetical protein